MAEQFEGIGLGLEHDGHSDHGAPGAPIGTAGFTMAANIGSIYKDESNGDLYTKLTSTDMASDWVRLARVNELGGMTDSFDGVTAATVVATALVDSVRRMDITIDVTDPTDGSGRSLHVRMGSDSFAGGDATDVFWARAGRIRHGALAGVSFSASLTGAGVTQAMNLIVTSVTSVNVRVRVENLAA